MAHLYENEVSTAISSEELAMLSKNQFLQMNNGLDAWDGDASIIRHSFDVTPDLNFIVFHGLVIGGGWWGLWCDSQFNRKLITVQYDVPQITFDSLSRAEPSQ